jgi:hypothetical protein
MKSLVVATALLLAAAVAGPSSPAAAQRAERYDWQWSNDARQVVMHDTEPTAADPHVHVKFKRHGGEGQRQVRIAERHKRPTTKFHYSRAVKLQVGERVVFTTKGFLPCEPARDPLQVDKQMRIKLPGQPWQEWVTWSSSTIFIMEC